MSEVSPLLLALALGTILGAMFFGGLWWTVARGTGSRHAARWFLLSLLLRTSAATFGFYLVGRGSWERLAACLAGFVLARLIVTRLIADAVLRPQSAGGANHAP
jgi:F1F0 ATPase subunit 2